MKPNLAIKNWTAYTTIIILLFFACKNEPKIENPIAHVLSSNNEYISRVIDSVEKYQVQIKFTQIDRVKDVVSFTDFDFQVDSLNYFYPASTVKFPIALVALSKLNTLENMDMNTLFYIEGDTLETTIKTEIEKIFAVSDNEANNRLFEFLGQDYINQELNKILDGPVRISHHLSAPNSDEITSKPLVIYLNDSTTTQMPGSINTSAIPLQKKAITKGIGYFEEDSLMQAPFDFSLKNYYPIETQHEFLKKVLFPEQYDRSEKLNLSLEQIHFVHKAMQTLPKSLGYDPEIYYDGYCKFFMYGDTKETIPDYIKIYNKVGNAYGTLTDCAYIHDTKNNVEFLLTATILVNKNGVFNDDTYEYDEIGFPFLAELGRTLYDYELKRKKK